MKRAVSGFLLVSMIFASTEVLFAQKRVKVRRPVYTQVREELPPRTKFNHSAALSDGSGVLVRWQMSEELGTVGYNVLRIEGGRAVPVRGSLIPGSVTRSHNLPLYGRRYAAFDHEGWAKATYVIEAVHLDGSRVTTTPIAVTEVKDLSAAAGDDAALIRKESELDSLVADTKQVMSEELRAEAAAAAQPPDPEMQKWVAAQPGVKIGVKSEGIYRVARSQLQAAGFNVSSDPALWQLYADGNQQAINVGPNGDYIEFYGNGIDTQESDTRFYFLLVGPTAGMRMASVPARRVGGTVLARNFQQTIIRKERTSYINSILNGDEENYWGRVLTSTASTFNFSMSGVDTNAGEVLLTFKALGSASVPHTVNLVLNGQLIGQANGPAGRTPYSTDLIVPASAFVEGNNALTMSTGSSTDFSFFDSITITYSRKFQADAGRIALVTPNYQGTIVSGFTSSSIRVFDITNQAQPSIVTGLQTQTAGGGFSVSLPPHRSRVYFAVEDSALSQPASVTQNGVSSLSTPAHNADLVVISYKDFLTQAEAWANYRRGQGFAVEVVNVEDIFDEYNYGSPGSRSMRAFLQYAKNNWQTPPRYVLLIGDGSYDPRNYEGLGNFNYVPAFIVNTVYSETASDDAIVDFDGDGLAEIAIGRIPARTGAHVTNALNKTMTFEQPAMQSLQRGALFACDSNPSYDFCGMSGRMRDRLPAGTPNLIVSRADPNANQTLIAEMNLGKYIVNYSGHGTLGVWASEAFFGNLSVPNLTNQSSPTIFTMLTCLNGFFHEITRTSLAENLLNSTAGGAAASWASSGLTTPDVQEIMGQRFYLKIGEGAIQRLGDLIIDAKSTVPGGSDVRESWVLIGDPMLKVR
ncbi:MAG: C25 family cysteine peptidase [Pyrinomonadaceae bacterium]